MISPNLVILISYVGAIFIGVSLWKAPKNPNWWLLNVIGSMIYTATMWYYGSLAWGLFGVYCVFVGGKNFVENRKSNRPHQ